MNESTLYTTAYSSYLLTSSDNAGLQNFTGMLFSNSSASNNTRPHNPFTKFFPYIVAEMIVSIICLVLSLIVYCILPEFKNVHGKNLISLSSCLLSTFVLLCLDLALRRIISYPFCFSIAVVTHITFLGTFFWTNVMTFDIWNNMTSMKRKVKSSSTKYLKYSAYAWTATVLTALVAIVLDSTELVHKDYRPKFGRRRCWLSGATAFYYYFNLPVGLILLGNLIMFGLTIRRLWIIKKTTAILQVKQQQKRLHLYLKLFFVMGFTWFMEFLPWITNIRILYVVAGILTALHGVFLFVIFILKMRILRQVKEKMFGKVSDKQNSTSQPTLSTSEQQDSSRNYADTKA